MSLDFLKTDSATILNAWIEYAEDLTTVTYEGERFLSGVDWNLQRGGDRYNDFLIYLKDNGLEVKGAGLVNEQSDWDQEQIWIRILPYLPEDVYSKFFGDRDYHTILFLLKSQLTWG